MMVYKPKTFVDRKNVIPPQKYIRNNFFDTARWENFKFRKDDIFIASYAKSGTTVFQYMVGLLLFDGEKNLPIAQMSPWLEFRPDNIGETIQKLDEQSHRRFIKTHSPADAIPYSLDAKYIYLVRDFRDVALSFHHKFRHAKEQLFSDLNAGVETKIERPPEGFVDYFMDHLMNRGYMGYPGWSYTDNLNAWEKLSNLDNLLIVHYADFLKEPKEQIKEVADFLELPLNNALLEKTYACTRFDYMKENGQAIVPIVDMLEEGHRTFMNKGENGHWKYQLTVNQSEYFEHHANRAIENKDFAKWALRG